MIDSKYEALRGKRVMVVDDIAANIFSLKICLKPYGLELFTFEEATSALEAITKDPAAFDCILMDVRMPGMDGKTAIGKIRDMQGGQALPVIAVTAQAMTGDRESCLESGANEYVTKPVDVPDLLDKMLSLLEDCLGQE